MFYTVYKITNWFNGKIYIGIHKTNDLNDDYMGSGKVINRAQEKYGLQYFTKEYLAIYDNPDDMYEMESCLVNEEFVKRSDTYNIKEGGCGGWDYINNAGLSGYIGRKHTQITLDLISEGVSKTWTKERRQIQSNKMIGNYLNEDIKKSGQGHPAYGKNKSKAHKIKLSNIWTEDKKRDMSNKAKERLKDPTKNSQYGTMWITNGQENKKISKDSDIPEGWYKGRNMP